MILCTQGSLFWIKNKQPKIISKTTIILIQLVKSTFERSSAQKSVERSCSPYIEKTLSWSYSVRDTFQLVCYTMIETKKMYFDWMNQERERERDRQTDRERRGTRGKLKKSLGIFFWLFFLISLLFLWFIYSNIKCIEKCTFLLFFFQAEDGIRDRSPSRGLGDVYKRQCIHSRYFFGFTAPGTRRRRP